MKKIFILSLIIALGGLIYAEPFGKMVYAQGYSKRICSMHAVDEQGQSAGIFLSPLCYNFSGGIK